MVIQYCLCRAYAVWLGIPSDAEKDEDAYDIYWNVNNLLVRSIVLAWFVGVTDIRRAQWLFAR